MFDPINPPPSDHHGFVTGHSTEFGDNPRTVVAKINAGFEVVFAALKGFGKSLADEVEYVAKTDFDAELDEVRAELANVKMMVQGLGFAGAAPKEAPTVVEPPAPDPDGEPQTGGNSEPVVTVEGAQ